MSEESKHSEWSPSGYSRWSNCAGSVAAIRALPIELRNPTNDYADEGTAAHSCAADCLRLDCNAEELIGTTYRIGDTDWEVTEEMAGFVQVYLDYVRALPGKHYVENTVAIPALPDSDNEGTSDHIAVDIDDGVIYVTDLKYGRGVKVFADEGQLKIYALGALKMFEHLPFDKAVLAIVQPRLDHIDRHTITVAELEQFSQQVEADVRATHAPDAPRVPGADQCRWCPYKAHCPELADWVREKVDVAPSAMSPEQLSKAVGAADTIEGWLEAVKVRANAEIRNGVKVPGWKLVLGREGNRKWADETVAEETLKSMRLPKESMYDFKVISPTTAEKLATKSKKQPEPVIGARQWKKLESLITRTPASPTLVHERDPRPAMTFAPPSAADMPDLDAPPAVAPDPVSDDAAIADLF